jgi:hypothetical protein
VNRLRVGDAPMLLLTMTTVIEQHQAAANIQLNSYTYNK